jgi:23S rRNA (adenine2503-C2)-methyltransferase
MKIIDVNGREDVALVYLARMEEDRFVEFVEALEPPIPRSKKWVLLVSTLYGCPVRCLMCDAGGDYQGALTAQEIFQQIDFLIRRRYPAGMIPAEKFKIQFARIGEPSFNPGVLDVLEALPGRYRAKGLIPALSTIAPRGREAFFRRLLDIRKRVYKGKTFQLQFSLHTTDAALRGRLVPAKTWSFDEIAAYGREFYEAGRRKITLNFAATKGFPIDPGRLRPVFDPRVFLLKLTPLNPTYSGWENRLTTQIDPASHENGLELAEALRSEGYDVLLSIGEPEENNIGSNCGQYVIRHLAARKKLDRGYAYVKPSLTL